MGLRELHAIVRTGDHNTSTGRRTRQMLGKFGPLLGCDAHAQTFPTVGASGATSLPDALTWNSLVKEPDQCCALIASIISQEGRGRQPFRTCLEREESLALVLEPESESESESNPGPDSAAAPQQHRTQTKMKMVGMGQLAPPAMVCHPNVFPRGQGFPPSMISPTTGKAGVGPVLAVIPVERLWSCSKSPASRFPTSSGLVGCS